MNVKGSKYHVIKYFHLIAVGLTVLFMIGSAVFVRFSRHSQPTSANAPTTIVNPIPFSSLNTSIALTLALNIILRFFGVKMVLGVHASLILTILLVTNKRSLKHLRLRLRQNIDSFTIAMHWQKPNFGAKKVAKPNFGAKAAEHGDGGEKTRKTNRMTLTA